MSRHLTPLEVCERLIGLPDILGPIAGRDVKSPYHWRNATKGRDAGDLPSTIIQRKLLNHAKANSIPLTADHLIFGADSAAIDALVAKMAVPMVAAE